MSELSIRRARRDDVPAAAALAGALVRQHHQQDPRRFMLMDEVEAGYAWWFGKELGREEAVLLVAVRGEAIVGYAYGALEERDFNMLLDVHGALHDIFVVPEERRLGTGAKLLQAMIEALEGLGAPRIILSTMVSNTAAQQLFARYGFRSTMLEMTRG
ncbi:MAG: GNAT family N-acetyltransferase [Myxococcota bacterium]